MAVLVALLPFFDSSAEAWVGDCYFFLSLFSSLSLGRSCFQGLLSSFVRRSFDEAVSLKIRSV